MVKLKVPIDKIGFLFTNKMSATMLKAVIHHELSHLAAKGLFLYPKFLVNTSTEEPLIFEEYASEEIRADTYGIFNSINPLITAKELQKFFAKTKNLNEFVKGSETPFIDKKTLYELDQRAKNLAWIIKSLEQELKKQ